MLTVTLKCSSANLSLLQRLTVYWSFYSSKRSVWRGDVMGWLKMKKQVVLRTSTATLSSPSPRDRITAIDKSGSHCGLNTESICWCKKNKSQIPILFKHSVTSLFVITVCSKGFRMCENQALLTTGNAKWYLLKKRETENFTLDAHPTQSHQRCTGECHDTILQLHPTVTHPLPMSPFIVHTKSKHSLHSAWLS